MGSRVLRLYIAAVTLLVFFVLWALIAARPWATTASRHALDPRLVALGRRQRRLQREAGVVKQTLDRRWREYRVRLRRREARIRLLERRHAEQVAAARAAAASTPSYASTSLVAGPASSSARVVTLPPQVKVVNLPPASSPVTSSGSSHP